MRSIFLTLMAALALTAAPATAQIRSVDPNAAAQADVAPLPGERGYATVGAPPVSDAPADAGLPPAPASDPATASGDLPTAPASPVATQAAPTYKKDDLIGAAEGVFGKGAAGLAGIIENILKDQGEPNAYIAGREASGAFVVGLRYGSGTIEHKIEGQRPVYWTGPSIGFDVGGDATKVFTLVYNLYDSQDLYKRYPQVEGRAYFVGGFSATYLRRGDVVLIPVRLGVGVRLGANVGYMKFSETSRWLPF
ncbi:MAG: DUF1134 domain-containing protein [Sphingomonadaceae bacterium]